MCKLNNLVALIELILYLKDNVNPLGSIEPLDDINSSYSSDSSSVFDGDDEDDSSDDNERIG
jgi:hypothetical protein